MVINNYNINIIIRIYLPLNTSTGTLGILIDNDLLEIMDDDLIGLNANALLNNAIITIIANVLYIFNDNKSIKIYLII